MGPGTLTAWQHDAQPLGADTLSVFDNGGPPSALRHSRGLVAAHRPAARTPSTLVASVAISTPIFAQTQGDLQRLPDGNWWIGWGNVNESSEVSAGGTQLFEAHTPAGSESYRTLRFPWSAAPGDAPAGRARRRANAACARLRQLERRDGVARWRLEAGSSPAALAPVGDRSRGRVRDRDGGPARRRRGRGRRDRRPRARARALTRRRRPLTGALAVDQPFAEAGRPHRRFV